MKKIIALTPQFVLASFDIFARFARFSLTTKLNPELFLQFLIHILPFYSEFHLTLWSVAHFS
jgi:hypothetical protein